MEIQMNITPVIEWDYSKKGVVRKHSHDVTVNGSFVCSLPDKASERDIVNHCKTYNVLADGDRVVIVRDEPRIENEYLNQIGL